MHPAAAPVTDATEHSSTPNLNNEAFRYVMVTKRRGQLLAAMTDAVAGDVVRDSGTSWGTWKVVLKYVCLIGYNQWTGAEEDMMITIM